VITMLRALGDIFHTEKGGQLLSPRLIRR